MASPRDTEDAMTAREVYELQKALRFEREKLRALADRLADETLRAARAGAFVGTTDWMRDPEYRALAHAVHVMETEVAAAQAEVGGKVYRVPGYKLADLTAKVEKVAKRARKLGVGEVTVRVAETEHVEVKPDDGRPWDPEATYRVVLAREYAYVVLAGEAPVLAGWRFLATLQHLGDGVNVVKRMPAVARAWREAGTDTDEAVAAAQAEIDAVDLTLYRAVAPKCDHCGYDRRRKNTYVVEYAETGELKQVGSNCLVDFLGGVDPHRVAKYAEYLTVLDDALGDGEFEDEGEGGWGGGMGSQFTNVRTLDYLAHVALMLRTTGWVARSAAGYGSRATADAAMDNLWAMARDARDRQGGKVYDVPTEDDYGRAEAALVWGREVLPKQDRLSDFDYNLATMAAQDYVPKRGDGILAYVVVAHARALEREIKLANEKKANAESAHFGEVGKRYTLKLTVEAVFEHEGHYGTTFITKFRDETGNVFKWFGSYELDRGVVYEGKWTVKDHGEWNGTAETVLNRPHALTEVEVTEAVEADRERVAAHKWEGEVR